MNSYVVKTVEGKVLEWVEGTSLTHLPNGQITVNRNHECAAVLPADVCVVCTGKLPKE